MCEQIKRVERLLKNFQNLSQQEQEKWESDRLKVYFQGKIDAYRTAIELIREYCSE